METYINHQQAELDKYISVAGMLRGYLRHISEHEVTYTKDTERLFHIVNEALAKTESIIYPATK